MPELGPYGSVRGARGNSRPYRERRHNLRRGIFIESSSFVGAPQHLNALIIILIKLECLPMAPTRLKGSRSPWGGFTKTVSAVFLSLVSADYALRPIRFMFLI